MAKNQLPTILVITLSFLSHGRIGTATRWEAIATRLEAIARVEAMEAIATSNKKLLGLTSIKVMIGGHDCLRSLRLQPSHRTGPHRIPGVGIPGFVVETMEQADPSDEQAKWYLHAWLGVLAVFAGCLLVLFHNFPVMLEEFHAAD